MNFKKILAILLIAIAAIMIVPAVSASDTLTSNDFKQTSFSKSIDYFDYVREYMSDAGYTSPSSLWHANVYMNYINTSGIQLLYAGLENISNSGNALNIPMQSFLLHYKTTSNSDAVLSSTFLMLMSFQENSSETVYTDSPDKNDTLYASFSLGLDLSAITDMPALNSKTTIIPLESQNNNLQWSWGMKYANLTAVWYRTWIGPNNESYSSWPVAITVYDELTFTYNLQINPTTGEVTIQENHVIGRMRDLFTNTLLFWSHYNSTGTYRPFLGKISDETIYDWLGSNNFKMSIVNYQTSIVADRTTHCQTESGQTINGTTETAVSDSSIDTFTDTNDKIFTADFGAKQKYKLYNYTSNPTETAYDEYDSNTRTALISSYAENTDLLTYQMTLANYLPFAVYHMHPGLYNQVKNSIANMSRADYFYIISYPTYSGFKVDHDPTFIAYATLTPDSSGVWGYLIIIAVVLAVIAVAVVLLRRKPKTVTPPANP